MQFLFPAVYSKRTEAAPFPLPGGWQLATHQLAVFEALQDPEIDVVFDTAMTGDGKTLAAHLPVLQGLFPFQPVFVYPTNELIRDQFNQAENLQATFGYQGKYLPEMMDGQAITALAQAETLHRYDAVRALIYGFKTLLTNPDLFTLINNFAYVLPFENLASLAQRFNSTFRYVVFDEFHIYDAAQVTAVLDTMVLSRSMATERHRAKYLFLSATPNDDLIRRLEASGFRCAVVQGEYREGTEDSPAYRRILQPISLDIQTCEASEGGIVGWFNQNLGQVEQFFEAYPSSKGAVICNSVLSAKRLVRDLQGRLPHVCIVENTGLTGKEARAEAMAALAGEGNVLLIATSTVDVGVDFRLNYLIFEALDAGSFIQRLGRLGRHEGFETYQATALLPRFLVERLTEYDWAAAEQGRRAFFEILREKIFPPPQRFHSFINRWGGVRAAQRRVRMRQQRVSPVLLESYDALAREVYGLRNAHFGHLKALSDPEDRQQAVLDELSAFRGAGQLDVWVYDPVTRAVTSINVLRLLSGAEVTALPKAEAQRLTEALGQRFYVPKLDVYFRIESYLDERNPVTLRSQDRLITPIRKENVALARSSFQIETRSHAQGAVNRKLRNLELCSCVLPAAFASTPSQARSKLRLPALFELHLVEDSSGAAYVTALGPDALLLDSIRYWSKTNDPDFV